MRAASYLTNSRHETTLSHPFPDVSVHSLAHTLRIDVYSHERDRLAYNISESILSVSIMLPQISRTNGLISKRIPNYVRKWLMQLMT